MKIRLLNALAAFVLAVLGAVLIISYVQGADQRALAGTKTRQVLVVEKQIAAGTPVSELTAFLHEKAIPISAMADGAMTSLVGASNTVTAVDLVPGEQLLRSRLVTLDTLRPPGTVDLPAGLQEVTVQLGPDRTVGARIKAGDFVGIFITFQASGAAPARTRLELQKVLVTSVQGAPVQPVSGSTTATAAPTGSMLVTFALSAANAEKIVFSAQNGTIWLSAEPASALVTDTSGTTQGSFNQ